LKHGPGIPAVVQVVERLGTETHVVAGIDAPRLRSAALTDAVDAAASGDDVLLADEDRASFTVVLDARAPVAVGDRIELTVDPDRLHHFDADSGDAIDLGTLPSRRREVVAPRSV
jgi:multiple sugar transport system ATP-binding protein